MNEAQIDVAIANLVHLKDGRNDDLAKLLNPAIEALKDYRTNRMAWRKMISQLREAEKLVQELRSSLGGKHARRK